MATHRLSVKSASFGRGLFSGLKSDTAADELNLQQSNNSPTTTSGSSSGRMSSVDTSYQSVERAIHDVDSPIVFDKPLAILMGRKDHLEHREHVPRIIRWAVSALYAATMQGKGLAKDGIFRESGSNTRIQELKYMFDEDLIDKHCTCQYVSNPFEIEDPHVTTGLLKLYLRSLPEPVATFQLYDVVVKIMRSGNANDEMNVVRGLKPYIMRLPELNRKLLNVILFILHECSLVNDKMKASNLGIVMGANIFRSNETSSNTNNPMAAFQDVQDLNKAVQIMIEHYYQFFTGEESYLFSVYPLYKNRLALEVCTNEVEEELKDPEASKKAGWVTQMNSLYEKNQFDPLKWRVSPAAVDDAVLDLKSLIDDKIQDPTLKQQFNDVYARIFHSIYYCEDAYQTDETEDDEDFKHGPVAYATLLEQKEDIWMREKRKLVIELESEKKESAAKYNHTKRTLERLLEQL
jgi:hypothetical protein